MTLQTSGPISINDLKTQFGGNTSPSLEDYYAGGTFVPSGTTGVSGAIPTSGPLSLFNFYGAPQATTRWLSSSMNNPATYTVGTQANPNYLDASSFTTTDSAGNIIVATFYQTDVTYTAGAGSTSKSGLGVWKYSADGSTLAWRNGITHWVYPSSPNNEFQFPVVTSIVTDSANNIYVSYYAGRVVEGSFCIMKLDSFGNITWNKRYVSTISGVSAILLASGHLSVDASDNLYSFTLYGSSHGGSIVSQTGSFQKLNPANGALVNTASIDVNTSQNVANQTFSYSGNHFRGVQHAVDSAGNYYYVTAYSSGATTGTTPHANDQLYIAKITTGGITWSRSLAVPSLGVVGSGTSGDGFRVPHISTDNANNLYIYCSYVVGSADLTTASYYVVGAKLASANTTPTLSWVKHSLVNGAFGAAGGQVNVTGLETTTAGNSYFGINTAAFVSSGGGGGGGSVSVQAYLPSGKVAGEVDVGDELSLLSTDRTTTVPGTVISNRTSLQPLVKLISRSGITLTCSDSTPVTLEDGSSTFASNVLNKKLPVQDDNGFRWEEIVSVTYAGMGYVATIFCENQCYAAGDAPGKYIWTHNDDQSKD
jgi:hypothetical protein